MKNLLIFPIKIYQKFVSPLFPPTCRYSPTCSNYSIQAIETHGILKGGLMGFVRVLRCNPFFKAGYDPVPQKFSLRRQKTRKKQGSS